MGFKLGKVTPGAKGPVSAPGVAVEAAAAAAAGAAAKVAADARNPGGG